MGQTSRIVTYALHSVPRIFPCPLGYPQKVLQLALSSRLIFGTLKSLASLWDFQVSPLSDLVLKHFKL